MSDGIGDPCQCGDPTNNGIVDAGDIQVIRERIVGATFSDTFVGARCNMKGPQAGDGSGSDCGIEDVYELQRQMSGLSNSAGPLCDAWFGL
jgi:hypothetical protein